MDSKEEAKNEIRGRGVNVDDLLEKALGHHRMGQLPEAEALYRTILKTDPN
ncbi:MAG TPA: hypothetical protein VGJ94_11395 [Syntrophorhabdaceae bacterium]|jgi:hypothetical protein